MADQTPVDPYKALHIVRNSDGTLTRDHQPPWTLASASHGTTSGVTSFDIPLNPSKNTYIRVFQPPVPPSSPKLPLVIFFHGGGFIFLSVSSLPYHEYCIEMASKLPALVLSVEYRYAPENRLPSAYEDAMEGMLWIKNQATKGEHKFFDLVDFSKSHVMGSSAGGNITYHVGLELSKINLDPLKINGLIMIQPFFGGVERSESELRLANDEILALPVTDLMWELSLPIGADRGHEYSNPMDEKVHEKVKEDIRKFPRCYVVGHNGDPLVDRQKKFVKMLEEDGVYVAKVFREDGYHGCELFDPKKTQEYMSSIKDFIYS